jgi:transcriptional regulator with XRE-family HTH domain
VEPELLGVRIRLARERLGMSQGDLADMVSKDQRAISEYENGRRKLAATDLVRFAEVLHVPLLFFFEGALTEGDLDREALTEFNRLPTFQSKQAAIEIMRVFANAMQLPVQ